jgi:hypothetical protein
MPQLPTYEANRNIQANPGRAFQEGAGAEARMVQQVAQVASGAVKRWSDANDVMQATESQNKFSLLLKDIEGRASADPDYRNSQIYLDEINKAKSVSVQGISNKEVAGKIRLNLDYNAEVTKINIDNGFKQKQLENNKVVLTQSISQITEKKLSPNITKAQSMQYDLEIAELLAAQVSSGVITEQEASKALFDARKSALEYDAVVNPKRVIDSDAERYGLPEDMYLKQKEVARKSIERDQKEEELVKEENRINTQAQLAIDLADKKIDKLSVPQVSAMIARGEIGREFGEAYIRVLTSPKSIDKKKNLKKSGFVDYAKNIFSSDDPQQIEKAVTDMLNGSADGKLSQEELAVLLKTANQKSDRGLIHGFIEGVKKFAPVTAPLTVYGTGSMVADFLNNIIRGDKVPEARNKAVLKTQEENPFYRSFSDKKIGDKVVLPNGVAVIFTGHDESGDVTFELAK